MVGKRIALIIGVSEYEHEDNLPACRNDLALVDTIVQGSEQYDDILLLNTTPLKSSEVKAKIADFVRKHQKQEIDQLLFYYTGHGSSHEDDFLFLFSDFSESKQEQTSLRNSELDKMLKSLKPSLTFKIVDACEAGTKYVKSSNILKKVLQKSSEDSFDKIYFFFSSSNTESSIALPDCSVFTKSFAQSVLKFKGENIRYRDIMDFISDDISVKKHQTPFFIQQADNTESFCNVSDGLASTLSSKLDEMTEKHDDEVSDSEPEKSDDSGVELTQEDKFVLAIKAKDKSYCSEKDAIQSLTLLVDEITKFHWPQHFIELFTVEIELLEEVDQLKSIRPLAKWLKDNPGKYFIGFNYETEEYEDKEKIEYEETPFGIGLMGRTKKTEYRPVTRSREVICGYSITAPTPSQVIIFSLNPKFEVLPWIKVFFTYTFSKSKLTLFFKYELERDINWNERVLPNDHRWNIRHCQLNHHASIKNLITESFNSIISSIQEEIIPSDEI